MDNTSDISQNLIDSVSAENIGEILLELSEAEIASLLDNEVLKNIPFVGILAKILGTSRRVSNALFAKKVLKFLSASNKIDDEKKKSFKEKMDKNPKAKKRVGETLMLLIDRMDDISKCELLGNLFRAFIDGKIDYSLFLRLSAMIDKVFLPDLIQLRSNRLEELDGAVKDLLAYGGILKSSIEDNRKFEENIRAQTGNPSFEAPTRYRYELSAFGTMLIKFAFYK